MSVLKKMFLVSMVINVIFLGFIGGKWIKRSLWKNNEYQVSRFIKLVSEQKKENVKNLLESLESQNKTHQLKLKSLRERIHQGMKASEFDSNQYLKLVKQYGDLKRQQTEVYADITVKIAETLNQEERDHFSSYIKNFHKRKRYKKHR